MKDVPGGLFVLTGFPGEIPDSLFVLSGFP
jgi:hypothetical protein